MDKMNVQLCCCFFCLFGCAYLQNIELSSIVNHTADEETYFDMKTICQQNGSFNIGCELCYCTSAMEEFLCTRKNCSEPIHDALGEAPHLEEDFQPGLNKFRPLDPLIRTKQVICMLITQRTGKVC